jgi:magnesium transporter
MLRTQRLRRRSRANGPAPESRGPQGAIVDAFLYDAQGEDRRVSLEDVAVDGLASDQLLWIDVASPAGVASVASVLGLDADTCRAIEEGLPQPALYVHEGYVHVVVVAPGSGAGSCAPLVVDCLVGSNWVVTVRREEIDLLRRFDERIRGDSDLGKLDAYGFLAAILHENVASYLAQLRPLEAQLDRLDLRSMTGRIAEEALLRELIAVRVRVAQLRRLLEPHRELYALLTRSEFAVLSGSRSAADFEALTELLERAMQSMEKTREMIIGSFEIYTTWTAHGTNRVMKRLTVASVTLLPPTLLAGVMGMNSLPSALAGSAAFWITIAGMSGLALTVVTFARLRDWL